MTLTAKCLPKTSRRGGRVAEKVSFFWISFELYLNYVQLNFVSNSGQENCKVNCYSRLLAACQFGLLDQMNFVAHCVAMNISGPMLSFTNLKEGSTSSTQSGTSVNAIQEKISIPSNECDLFSKCRSSWCSFYLRSFGIEWECCGARTGRVLLSNAWSNSEIAVATSNNTLFLPSVFNTY